MQRIGRVKIFEGWQETWAHESEACDCTMRFALYLPPQAGPGPVPAVYWLSGLTCTEENFMTKAGAQRYAAELGLALVAPDTSPRGPHVPDDEEAWDLGTGAGFYLNATREPWSQNYRMFDYVTDELPRLLERRFGLDPELRSVSGHSMGGHGALIAALRNPGHYRSVSAFAPVCAPSRCPWGVKAFSTYLGGDRESWSEWDACALLEQARTEQPLLVDQGDADEFLQEQLKPELLEAAAAARGWPLTLRMRPGYGHGYEFVATFIGEHLRYHAGRLRG